LPDYLQAQLNVRWQGDATRQLEATRHHIAQLFDRLQDL
jgi:hypothetical protein